MYNNHKFKYTIFDEILKCCCIAKKPSYSLSDWCQTNVFMETLTDSKLFFVE